MSKVFAPAADAAQSSFFFWRGMSAVRLAVCALFAITVFRLWYSVQIELVPDEAYYWLWSKHLAASYRDKGPAIAWTIALGTSIFGDTVFGIRFFAVLLSTAAAWIIFSLARRLYDDKTALWCLLVVFCIPLLAVGSILMTIDSLSVFAWAWAVYVLWVALESRKTLHWFFLGLIIGFGFLAKFTNGLQLGCIALFLIWSKPHRALLFSRQTVAMCAAFLLSILPIIYWNIQTGWIHAAALHSRSGVKASFGIHPGQLLQFIGGEAAVIFPLLFIGLVIAAVGLLWRKSHDTRTQFLLSQFLPVYGIFLFFSLNAAGKENWPAPALITGIVMLVVFWQEAVDRSPRWRWAVYSTLGLAFLTTAILHNTDFLRLPAKLEPLRRARGWTDFANHVQRARDKYHPTLLIGNHYSIASIMQFYLPDQPETHLPEKAYGQNQFTLWPGFDAAHIELALFVTDSTKPMPKELLKAFSDCQLVDEFWSQHNGRPMTHFKIYLCKHG